MFLDFTVTHCVPFTAIGLIVVNGIALIVYLIKKVASDSRETRFNDKVESFNTQVVDLGLSVKWSANNKCYGAIYERPYGDLCEWANSWRTNEDSEHSMESYTHCRNSKFVKYNTDAQHGTVDGKVIMDPSDDPANVWLQKYFPGKVVRIPTVEECRELIEKCTWVRDVEGVKQGFRVTGPSGNSIFLPIKKWSGGSGPSGLFWTNHLGDNPLKAKALVLEESEVSIREVERWTCGMVRFVVEDKVDPFKSAYKPYSAYSSKMPSPVDLGLKVFWASQNVGAGSLEKEGYSFSWGDVKGFNAGKWESYKLLKNGKLTRYNTSDQNGRPDNLKTLRPSDDMATSNIPQEGWRTPTLEDFYELVERCEWEWATCYGVKGCKVTGPSGNWIFLPMCRRISNSSRDIPDYTMGFYWTSVLGENPLKANALVFGRDGIRIQELPRYYDIPVRAVKER